MARGVGEERGVEGDVGVEGLADEEVAVVERGGEGAEEEVVWGRTGDGRGCDAQALVRLLVQLGSLIMEGGALRVVDFARLAVDFLELEGSVCLCFGRHGG